MVGEKNIAVVGAGGELGSRVALLLSRFNEPMQILAHDLASSQRLDI